MAKLPGAARFNQYYASPGQTVFTYDYFIATDAEIKVQIGDATLELTTNYTVQDAGVPTGGTITLLVGTLSGDIITLTGDTLIQRVTEFQNNGDFLASAINGEYDILDDITSELLTETDGAFTLAVSNPAISTAVPSPVAGKCLKWNATENAIELSEYDPDDAQGSAAAAAISAAAALVSENNASDSADESAISAAEAAASAASLDLSAVDKDVVPETNDMWDLGSPTHKWKEIFVEYGVINNQLLVGGNSFLDGTLDVGGNTEIDGTLTVGGESITPNKAAAYSYVVAYNVEGGAYVATTWNTRPINTEEYDDIGITLSSNALTLPAGTYKWNVDMAFCATGWTQMKLRQTSGSLATLGRAVTTYANSPGISNGSGVFTLAASETLEVWMLADTSITNGMGLRTNNAALGNNTYLNLLLEKL